jgi:tetratricopeptide (TPR) repeat protein
MIAMRQHSGLLLGLVTALAGCGAAAEEKTEAVSPAYPTVTVSSGEVALVNLDAQILGLEQALALRPNDFELASRFSGLSRARVHFRGSFEDLSKLLALAQRQRAVYPDRRETQLLLADALAAVHRFDEAGGLYATLPGPAGVDGMRMLRLATGRGGREEVSALQREARENPSYDSYSALALACIAVGQYTQADAAFVEAMGLYRDSSPLPLAWVAFQRGLMWAESADQPGRAIAHYRQALRWLPGYVVAAVHLAELERDSTPHLAIDRLEPLVSETADPEAKGLLAELLRRRGHSGDFARAQKLVLEATARYELLLARHPAAFWDHAAEHYAGPGDRPARALTLAQRNLTLRPTSRAYLIALDAAEALGDEQTICALVRGAKGLRFRSATLDSALAHWPSCG